jgi:hypothetical protein
MADTIKKSLTVQWIVNRKDKKLIKFVEGEDKTYKLADNVLEHLNGIKTNTIVNVTIEGENIVYIAVKGEAVKTEEVKKEVEKIVTNTPQTIVGEDKKVEPFLMPKVENSKLSVETNQNVKVDNKFLTYKVKGYSKDLLWWLFEETGEKIWFGVDDKMIPFMRNVKKGDILKISGESRESRGKDVDFITSAELVTKSQETVNSTNEQPKKGSYSNDADARAKNTALMVAKDIVVVLLNKDKIDNKKIKEVLMDLTKICYETLNSI